MQKAQAGVPTTAFAPSFLALPPCASLPASPGTAEILVQQEKENPPWFWSLPTLKTSSKTAVPKTHQSTLGSYSNAWVCAGRVRGIPSLISPFSLSLLHLLYLFTYLFTFVRAHVRIRVGMLRHSVLCGVGSLIPPSTQILRTGRRQSALHGKHLYSLSHLAGPSFPLKKIYVFKLFFRFILF